MDSETVSPLLSTDITEICRTSGDRLMAVCAGSGETIRGKVHLPSIAHGFYCGACCPCLSFVPTPEEQRAIVRNRARSHREYLEWRKEQRDAERVVVAVPKPKPTPKPKPGSAKQYWLEKQSKLIVRVDPSKAPRGGQGAKAFKMIQDGMPYLAAQQVVTQRFSNGKILLANLRTRKAIRWSES